MFAWQKIKELLFASRRAGQGGAGELDPERIPRHLAIIMDGNGRWASRRGLPRMVGHRAGADKLRDVCSNCCQLGIRYLTVYAFSTENWSRPQEEVQALMDLVIDFFQKYDAEMAAQGIRLRFAGDLTGLPEKTRETIEYSERISAHRDKLDLIVCINYGGRQELVRATNRLIDKASRTGQTSFTETDFAAELFMGELPDPDLLIRPGGERRISNFLLWQLAYTELYFCDCLWPDFSREELIRAVEDYQSRDRRYGGLTNKRS